MSGWGECARCWVSGCVGVGRFWEAGFFIGDELAVVTMSRLSNTRRREHSNDFSTVKMEEEIVGNHRRELDGLRLALVFMDVIFSAGRINTGKISD